MAVTIANVEMAEAWDGAEGDHWTEHAERYESIGPGFWDALAHAVAFRVDDQVVDIGCGTGRSTRTPLASRRPATSSASTSRAACSSGRRPRHGPRA